MLSISKRERDSLILGVLAFVVGPVVGVFAIFYILRRLKEPNCTKAWPYRLALCLTVIGILVFCVTTLLLVPAIIQ
jgi:undecaprenyl pyrophosphate phosphatase UppP